MPNWCYTAMNIHGDYDELTQFITRSSAGYEIVEPKEGDPRGRGNRLEPQITHQGVLSFGAITGVPSDYAQNWYDRGVEMWGTKWDVEVELDDVSRWSDQSIYFTMNSAWAFPARGVKAWSAAFPKLLFTGTITEESDAFAGAFVAKGGELLMEDYEPSRPYLPEGLDLDSPEGWQILEEYREQLMEEISDRNDVLLAKLERELNV